MTEQEQSTGTRHMKIETDEDIRHKVNLGPVFSPELPLVSLLQKTSSSPVTCHATGFYPDRAMLYWTKDGEELHENVYPGEILPNHDGTFQMSVDLDVSSLPSEDWEKYKCVFKFSEVKEDILTRLDRAVIRTNGETKTFILCQGLGIECECCL